MELCQGKEKRLLNKKVSHALVIYASLRQSKSTKVIPCQTCDPFSIKLMQLILDCQSNPIRQRVSVYQREILRILFLRKKLTDAKRKTYIEPGRDFAFLVCILSLISGGRGGGGTLLYGLYGYVPLDRVYNFVRVCTFKYRKIIKRKKFVLQVYTSDDHNAIAINA